MDDLTLAMGLAGSTSTETRVDQEIPTNASIVYMIAVTSSSVSFLRTTSPLEEDVTAIM